MQETKDGKCCKTAKLKREIQVPKELDIRPIGRKDAHMCIQELRIQFLEVHGSFPLSRKGKVTSGGEGEME